MENKKWCKTHVVLIENNLYIGWLAYFGSKSNKKKILSEIVDATAAAHSTTETRSFAIYDDTHRRLCSRTSCAKAAWNMYDSIWLSLLQWADFGATQKITSRIEGRRVVYTFASMCPFNLILIKTFPSEVCATHNRICNLVFCHGNTRPQQLQSTAWLADWRIPSNVACLETQGHECTWISCAAERVCASFNGSLNQVDVFNQGFGFIHIFIARKNQIMEKSNKKNYSRNKQIIFCLSRSVFFVSMKNWIASSPLPCRVLFYSLWCNLVHNVDALQCECDPFGLLFMHVCAFVWHWLGII